MTTIDTDEITDGRTARRDRNREIVLDATIELFAEGMLIPGAIEVAERSGVSLRSVYRYFEDMDELVRAAIDRQQERSREFYQLDLDTAADLDDRVARIVDQRMRLYEELAPVARATLAHVRQSALLRDRLNQAQGQLAAQIEALFAPELQEIALRADREIVAAVDVLLSFQAMEHLRTARGVSAAATRRTLIRAVTALLTP